MTDRKRFRLAVVGAGVSGIAAADTMQRLGHEVVVFERSTRLGGVWANAYPGVSLQNIASQYRLSHYQWPVPPDLHPTAQQILDYLQYVVAQARLDLRMGHDVRQMSETSDGRWQLTIGHQDETSVEVFDKLILAVGHYSQGKQAQNFAGRDSFNGEIITENDIGDFADFSGKSVLVAGFGKSALDVATMAVEHGARVHHLFRQPRWLVPRRLLGMHYTHLLFSRVNSVMMTSWAQPTAAERVLHDKLGFVVQGFWKMISAVIRRSARSAARGAGPDAARRIQVVLPAHPLAGDLRSAAALAPDNYYAYVARGEIETHHAELQEFRPNAVMTSAGRLIQADTVVLSHGSKSPAFPYLPAAYRRLLESESDGPQLYRHLIHPEIPNLGFAGYNHGFMHIPAVEIGTLWLDAHFQNRLVLPETQEMLRSMERVRLWKRRNIHFEPSRSCAVNTRYQQYLDILLKDLALSANRKLPNVFAELFSRYTAGDYAEVLDEYLQRATSAALKPLAVDT